MPFSLTCGRKSPVRDAVNESPAGYQLVPSGEGVYARLAETYGLARSYLIYSGRPWRARRLRQFYAQFVRPGDLCLDIGAHLGNRLRALASLGARVVALEPNPVLSRFLQRKYGNRPGIKVLEQAVGAAAGTAVLHSSRANPTVATLSRDWAAAVSQSPGFARLRWDQSFRVSVTTLDTLIAEFGLPALCKLDVEGFELEALRGLSKPIATVSFEYIPAARALAIGSVKRLLELGRYRFNWTIGESTRLQSPDWISGTETIRYLETVPADHRSGDIYAHFG